MNGFQDDARCAACVHVCVEVVCSCILVYINVCLFILYLYLCLFQAETFLLSSRRLGGLGSVTVKKIPRIHSEKRLAFMLCWRGGLPMTSFKLTHCLFDPAAVSVVLLFVFLLSPIGLCLSVCMHAFLCVCIIVCLCVVSLESSTPAMARLQNSATLRLSPPHTAPACTSSLSDYLGSYWQSIVCYTDKLFVYRGS